MPDEKVFVSYKCAAHIANVQGAAIRTAIYRGALTKLTAVNGRGQAKNVIGLNDLARHFKWNDAALAEIAKRNGVNMNLEGPSILTTPDETPLPAEGVVTFGRYGDRYEAELAKREGDQ